MLRKSLFVILVALAPPVDAQQTRDPERVYMSRGELAILLDWYQRSAQSPVYSDRLRGRADREADNVRDRLEGGDFQVGDRIPLVVDGEAELTDTFTVSAGKVLRFGAMGEVPLDGVLRSELDGQLLEFFLRFLRDPSLKSQPLIRLTIEGAVGFPGFYSLPSETPLPDAIMLAGGPTGDTRLQDIHIERGLQTLWSGDALRRAMAEGRTLDQLNLRAGDRIVLPARQGLGGAQGAVRTISILLALPLTLVALLQIF